MFFSSDEYNSIYNLVFNPEYLGYNKFNKHYNTNIPIRKHSLIKQEYLKPTDTILQDFLNRAHSKSLDVAKQLGVPDFYLPDLEDSRMRIVQYPPGAETTAHYDRGLFTLTLYRDFPEYMKYLQDDPLNINGIPMCYGKLFYEIGLGEATLHKVFPSEHWHHSIIYFAIPTQQSIEQNRIDRNVKITGDQKYPHIPGIACRPKPVY